MGLWDVCRVQCQQGCAPGTTGTAVQDHGHSAPGTTGTALQVPRAQRIRYHKGTALRAPQAQWERLGLCSSSVPSPSLCDPGWAKKATISAGQGSISGRPVDFGALGSSPFFPLCQTHRRGDATQAPGRWRRDGKGLLHPHPFRLHIPETESASYYLACGPQGKKSNKKKIQQVLERSLPIPAQSHLSIERKKGNPGKGWITLPHPSLWTPSISLFLLYNEEQSTHLNFADTNPAQ